MWCLLVGILLSGMMAGCVKKEASPAGETEEVLEKGGEKGMVDLTGKKVLMVIAPTNFRDEELAEPKNVLGSMGAEIEVTAEEVAEAVGVMGTKVKIDKDLKGVRAEDYDGVVFVGGPGTTVYFNDPAVLELAKRAVGGDKVVGAICIAPSILANAGLVKGKRVTSFASEKENLVGAGAIFTGGGVEVDGKMVTADGPASARSFGEKLAEVLGR